VTPHGSLRHLSAIAFGGGSAGSPHFSEPREQQSSDAIVALKADQGNPLPSAVGARPAAGCISVSGIYGGNAPRPRGCRARPPPGNRIPPHRWPGSSWRPPLLSESTRPIGDRTGRQARAAVPADHRNRRIPRCPQPGCPADAAATREAPGPVRHRPPRQPGGIPQVSTGGSRPGEPITGRCAAPRSGARGVAGRSGRG
jgi:hypothetical protein